ncbi:hypothetical protein [Prevotella fusca]|uniref:Uncharacterized protein n=1 Tax=Prevotella fusca JCM 17724 TaxID=1236517 RepID=A0A0K1NMD4_9BACT|nr:hypothetical protein [Prevotella fusca]AKU70247.1 hypothetical protein ADJ77_10685 [Prevotella fusca JCM 17724]
MEKIKNKLDKVIVDLKNRQSIEPKLDLIISRLEKTKSLLSDNIRSLTLNPINGITRAYLDIFSDYEDPIINDLYFLEKEINAIIK